MESVRNLVATAILEWDPTLLWVSNVAVGGLDSCLRLFADSVRGFGHPWSSASGRDGLLRETAVGPETGQAQEVPNAFARMRQYGTLGLVWFEFRLGRRDLPPGLAH